MKVPAAILAISVMTQGADAAPAKVYGEFSANNGIAFSLQRDPKKDPLIAYDVVSAWKGTSRVANCERWRHTLKGVTWCFSSERNLAAFTKATDKEGDNSFLPALGGHCALGTSWGYPGPKGDPTTAKVYVDDRGEKVLVLQSHPKWVPVFDRRWRAKYELAVAAFNTLKASGVIVNNADVPAEVPAQTK